MSDGAREITLSKGHVALVDAEDAERIATFRWHLHPRGYAVRYLPRSQRARGAPASVGMHREITKAPAGFVVDHADHDALNNRRANLRVCSQQENSRNRGLTKRTGTKGIFQRSNGRWCAQIKLGAGERQKWLGTFATAEEAARAYDAAALLHFGEFAFLNFPEAA